MNHRWTYRAGEITDKDKTAIRGIAQTVPAACQIFLTGEVVVDRVGELVAFRLFELNNSVDEPLFVFPRAIGMSGATISMTRFDAAVIWPLLGVPLLRELIKAECRWLSVEPFDPLCFDFYEALFVRMGLFDTYQAAPRSLYLNALTLFRKPSLGGTHISAFFSSAHSLTLNRAKMPESMRSQRDEVWNTDVQWLTNAELDFLVNIR